MFVVGFVVEEGEVQGVESLVLFGGFDFKGVGCVGSAPASDHCEVGFLVYGYGAVCFDVFEVNGAVPVHIPVAWGGLSVACSSVDSAYVYAHCVVV